MLAEDYDAWYRTPRGAWIGDAEYTLLRRMLAAERRSSLLEVGCGTGYFTRRFARDGHAVAGVDLDPAMVDFAQAHAAAGERYGVADALALPFADRSFDFCISVTALCFVRDERKALCEMVRVARRGIALGLLNRQSLLYWQKGRHGGRGAYQGAHWHSARETRRLLGGSGLGNVVIRSAIYLPNGGSMAQRLEAVVPGSLPLGGFLLAVGDLA